MPTARYNATAVGYHSMLIVVGGTTIVENKWTGVSTMELLDTTNGYWYSCNNLSSARTFLQATILNDLYILSGADKNRQLSPEMFVASLDTLSTHKLNWQSAPNNPCCGSPLVVLYKFCINCRRTATKCHF